MILRLVLFKNIIKSVMKRSPFLMETYRELRNNVDKRQVSVITPWGFKLSGNKLMSSGQFEPLETQVVRDLLAEVDLFVNIGANVGYYCCHALNLGKPVIAMEPMSRNLHYLLRNITENDWANLIDVFPVAVGAKTDVLKLWGGDTSASLVKGWANIDEGYVTQVPILTLDRILNTEIENKRALIMADIEGAEYMMLQGAKNTLMNSVRPIWVLEVSSTEHQPDGVEINPAFIKTFKTFFDSGYKAYTIGSSVREVTLHDVESIAKKEISIETHNFVFR